MIRTHLPKSKWNKESVTKYILSCRADKGLPIFKPKFAGMSFEVDNKPAVMATCWAGNDVIGSKVFYDVPKEDLELIEEGTGDWKKLLRKYGTPEQLKRAEITPIIIGGKKL